MTNKQIIIDGVDVSGCPAMCSYNIFGIEDKPCCYKFHEYCSTIPKCYFKELKRTVHKLQIKEQALDEIEANILEYEALILGKPITMRESDCVYNIIDIIKKVKEI